MSEMTTRQAFGKTTRRGFLQKAGIAGALTGTGVSAVSCVPDNDLMADMPVKESAVEQKACNTKTDLHPAHPFWPVPRLTLVTDHKKHRSRGSGLVILKDKWLFFWREANIHGATDQSAVIKMGESRNGGQVITNVRTIYDEGPDAKFNASDLRVRVMGEGRIGLFAVRNSYPDADWADCIFMHSDDGGNTWSKRVLALGNATHPGFTFNDYPASVGGHDTEGYIVYFKSKGRRPWPDKEDFVALYTTDNGNNWSYKTVLKNAPERSHEMSVVRLGQSDRWIMTWRQSKQSGVAGIARSEDMINWDGPYKTNTKIPSNPSTIIFNKGYITWLAASRPFHYRNDDSDGIRANGEMFNGIVTKTADAEAIWKNPSSWPEWSILTYLPVHFDGTFVHNQGHWYMIFGAVEGPMRVGRKYYSQLGVMSSVNAPGPARDGFLPGWMVEPEDVPEGNEGAIKYEKMVK